MILIVLPAYNEESSIGPLLESIDHVIRENHLEFRVIVVNDGSKDKTGEVVRRYAARMPLDFVEHPQNRGLGEAIKTGLLRGVDLAGDRDVLITMDSDNSHNPELIIRMFRVIREGHDVVIASRYQKGARIIGVPFHRRVLSFWASILLRVAYPITGVRDYTCGYRAYRAEVLREAWSRYGAQFIEKSGFSCMVELLLKLRSMNLIMGEVPLVLRYDQKQSASKMAIMRNIRDILAIVGNRWFIRKKNKPDSPSVLMTQHSPKGKN